MRSLYAIDSKCYYAKKNMFTADPDGGCECEINQDTALSHSGAGT